MDNIGDWLYIVIIAVAGLSSLLSSGKKKKQAEQERRQQTPPDIVTPQTASDRDFWDELFKEQREERQVQPKPVVTKVSKKKKSIQNINTKVEKPEPFLQGESDIERAIRLQGNTRYSMFMEEEETPVVSASDFHDPEVMRKAVIYSEILNRKY